MRTRMTTAAVAVAAAVTVSGCAIDTETPTANDATVAAQDEAEPAVGEEPAEEEPVVEEPVVEEPIVEEEPVAEAGPELTAAQEQARRSAENYLSVMGFSRSGLIEQLEFEQHASEDATAAVDALDVDWNEQAVRSAQNYLDTGMGFSRGSLIDQLVFSGFTQEQAEAGATGVGL